MLTPWFDSCSSVAVWFQGLFYTHKKYIPALAWGPWGRGWIFPSSTLRLVLDNYDLLAMGASAKGRAVYQSFFA